MNTEQLTYPMMLDFECGKDIFDPQESNMISQWKEFIMKFEKDVHQSIRNLSYGET